MKVNVQVNQGLRIIAKIIVQQCITDGSLQKDVTHAKRI